MLRATLLQLLLHKTIGQLTQERISPRTTSIKSNELARKYTKSPEDTIVNPSSAKKLLWPLRASLGHSAFTEDTYMELLRWVRKFSARTIQRVSPLDCTLTTGGSNQDMTKFQEQPIGINHKAMLYIEREETTENPYYKQISCWTTSTFHISRAI